MKTHLYLLGFACFLGISPLAYLMIVEQAYVHEALSTSAYRLALGEHRWLAAPGDVLCGPDFDLSYLSSSHLTAGDFWWYVTAHIILNTLGWFLLGALILLLLRWLKQRRNGLDFSL